MSSLRHGDMTQRNWAQMEALFGVSGGGAASRIHEAASVRPQSCMDNAFPGLTITYQC
jgi:hypothetical protein